MTHFQIEPENIIKVPLPGAAALLKPVVYIEGKYYCILLGPDAEDGVFGRGRTLEKAFVEWDKSLKKHLTSNDDDDYIVQHVRSIIGAPDPIVKKGSADVKEFYNQFKL